MEFEGPLLEHYNEHGWVRSDIFDRQTAPKQLHLNGTVPPIHILFKNLAIDFWQVIANAI